MSPTEQNTNHLELQTRRPFIPGAMLADFLKNTNITQGEAAQRMKVSRQTVSDLVNDRRYLTPNMANRLAIFRGDNPSFWLRLQQQRDVWDALHMDKTTFRDAEAFVKAA